MEIFERLKRLQGKKKQMPSPLRQVVELHITQQDTDDDAFKKKVLKEALLVYNATDEVDTFVNMLSLYQAMEALMQANGLKMSYLEWLNEQKRHMPASRFTRNNKYTK